MRLWFRAPFYGQSRRSNNLPNEKLRPLFLFSFHQWHVAREEVDGSAGASVTTMVVPGRTRS